MVCFNKMNLVLFILLFLVCFGAMYALQSLNRKRKTMVENFIDETIQCTNDNIKEYTTRYIAESNLAFKDKYEKCTDFTTTVDIPSRMKTDPLIDLMIINSRLNDSNVDLIRKENELNSNLSDSNAELIQKQDLNSSLTDSNNSLSSTNSNLEGISNILQGMNAYQSKIDKLSNLDSLISGQICEEMGTGSNCGLIHYEQFTREKLQLVLQYNFVEQSCEEKD